MSESSNIYSRSTPHALDFEERILGTEDLESTVAPAHDQMDLTAPVSGTVVDLRSLDYVTDYDQHLACPICRCPFVDPIGLPCSHSYCRICYYKALEAQSSERKSCPTCRRPIEEQPLPVPRFLANMIDELMVKCPNSTSGCGQELRRGDVQAHVNYHCEWTQMHCPDPDCGLTVPRALNIDRCQHRDLACKFCRVRVPELDFDDHLRRHCKRNSFMCSDCGISFCSTDRDEHAIKCPEAVQACSAASTGCNFSGPREGVHSHVRDCPLVKMAPFLQSMNGRIENQAAEIRSLQAKNSILEGSLEIMQRMLEKASEPVLPSITSLPGVPTFNGATSINDDTDQDHAMTGDWPSHQVENAPFNSAAHHMLSLHESLREEVDRVSAAIAEVDGKANLAIINETLRIREEMAHQNAAISSLRVQLQWLMSARLQAQARAPGPSSAMTTMSGGAVAATASTSDVGPAGQAGRRLSDSSRQDVKL